MTLFHYYRDPGADGVGVAFTSAELDLADTQDASARAESFARLSDAVGAAVAVVTQVHGNRVLDVTASGTGLLDLTAERADAMITDLRGVALAVRVADCIPVLFADRAAGLVGAAHAGRAGLLSGILGRTVEALRGRGAAGVHAWIGPHICGDCYEVPPAMADAFADATGVPPTVTRWGTTGVDIGAAARRQLDAAGVRTSSHEACTMHDVGLRSHRRSAAGAGRLAGLVWLA